MSLRNEDLPFRVRANVEMGSGPMCVRANDTPVTLTDDSLRMLELLVVSRFTERLLGKMCECIAEDGNPALTDEEFKELVQWFDEIYPTQDDLIERIMNYPTFYINVRDRYCEILAERQHYYKVTFTLTSEVTGWIKARDANTADDLTDDVTVYDLSNAGLLSGEPWDFDISHISYPEEATDEYCGDDLVAEEEY